MHVLRNVPKISDVAILREVMGDIGFEVRRTNGDGLELRAREGTWPFVPLEAAIKMRASFILLGPMLARFGASSCRTRVATGSAGGRSTSTSPPWRRWAPTIDYRNGYYFASAPPTACMAPASSSRSVTVMGTENAMMAATLARGTTVIDNAALEPEIDDLIAMLCAMGAQIQRTAERRIEVQGVERLGGAEHRVMGDRLEAGTFAIAAAITRGDVTLNGINPAHLGAFLEVCDRIGVAWEADATGDTLVIRGAPAASCARWTSGRTPTPASPPTSRRRSPCS